MSSQVKSISWDGSFKRIFHQKKEPFHVVTWVPGDESVLESGEPLFHQLIAFALVHNALQHNGLFMSFLDIAINYLLIVERPDPMGFFTLLVSAPSSCRTGDSISNSCPPDLELDVLTKWIAIPMLVCVSALYFLLSFY
jgi:hypothetical protein